VNNIVNQEVKKNIPPVNNANIANNPNNANYANYGNKNIILAKAQGDFKKKDSDNKDIAEAMRKVELKKKTPANPLPLKQEVNKEVKKLININYNQQINMNNKNDADGNPLQELMKKARADMKNKPKDEVIWLGKEKEAVPKKKEEREMKFPKVIIVEKEKDKERYSRGSKDNVTDFTPATANNVITVQVAVPVPVVNKSEMREKKTQEELYNLNRILNELAKIENEEENDSDNSKDINLESRPSTDLTEERDFNEIEETESNEINILKKDSSNSNSNGSYSSNAQVDTYSDNTQIEELRIELENSLGFELFKKIYKTVELKVNF
jgi:hypothetical protein